MNASAPLIHECVFRGNTSPYGGAAVITNGSSATVEDCLFSQNSATILGGAIDNSWSANGTYTGCVFTGNHGDIAAGGLHTYFASPTVTACTFIGNSTDNPDDGAQLICGEGVFLAVDHTIIAFGHVGLGMSVNAAGTASLSCTDIFGNEGGDWVGGVASQAGTNGNSSSDPLFCDILNGDYTLNGSSPCTPPQSSCGLIGAAGVGCNHVSVEPPLVLKSWGSIKSGYR